MQSISSNPSQANRLVDRRPRVGFDLWSIVALVHGWLNQSWVAGQDTAGSESSEGRSQRGSLMSSTNRYLWRETAGLRDSESFDVEVNRLYRESRSPLRARSLQSHRVQNSTFEEWEQLFSEGKVIRHEILKEVGAYLAQQDPDKALQLLFNQRGRMKFKNLEQYYALRDSIIATITRTDPEKVLDVFRGIGREGGYMDNARFFSQSWARTIRAPPPSGSMN